MKKTIALLAMAFLLASPLAFAYYSPDGADIDSTGLEFEGATADAYETTITVTDPTADRTITVPNATGTISLVNSDETSTGTKTVQNLNVLGIASTYRLVTTGQVTIASMSATTATIGTPSITGNQENTGNITVNGNSVLNGAVTVSSGNISANITTASLVATSGTVINFPIAASTAVASGATAGSVKIINDGNGVTCGTGANGGVGTSVVVCVSDGTNWIPLNNGNDA